MKTKNIIEGLTILQKYRDNEDGYHVDAEHDVLYAIATDRPLSEDDVARMVELGWFQYTDDSNGDEIVHDDFRVEHYDPFDSWQCFV